MKNSIISLRIFFLLIVVALCLNGYQSGPQTQYPEYKVVENKELNMIELHHNGIIYLSYGGSFDTNYRGKQIGIHENDPESKICEVKGYSSNEWIIEYSDVLMGGDMLFKAVSVTDIPRELEQYKLLYTDELPRLKTLDDAVKWYLNEKESNKYLEGQHFVSAYRILDTIELPTNATVYAHMLCEWIDLNGETVSGGAGLISITFNQNNVGYQYKKSKNYDGQPILDISMIPQKVKDAVTNDAYFKEMQLEINKQVADFLETVQ